MPALSDWHCDEEKCELRIEDKAYQESFKISKNLAESETAQTRSQKEKVRALGKVIEHIEKKEYEDELKTKLSEISDQIIYQEIGAEADRSFSKISVPSGNERLMKTIDRTINKIRYKHLLDPKTKKPRLRRAYKQAIKLTCHKVEDGWTQERIDTLTPYDNNQPSNYEHLPNLKPTLIVVHTIDLGKQWVREMAKDFFLNVPIEEIGEIGDQKQNLCPITVTTYQSLAMPHMQDALKGKIGMVVVDETHHGSAKSWNRGIKGLDVKTWKLAKQYDEESGRIKTIVVPAEYLSVEKRPLKLGLSATPAPFGPDRKEMLEEVIGQRLASVKDSDIVKSGFILPVKMRRIKLEPQKFSKELHDAAKLINTDSREHIEEIRAIKWNRNYKDITNLHLYKLRDEEVPRESNQALNASGVMFESAAMDENKLKHVLQRIAQSPDENFLVYSPRVLPLYTLSKATQSSGVDPPGCRVRFGEPVQKNFCEGIEQAECEQKILIEEGEEKKPCVWSKGTLPFVGKASRKFTNYRDVAKELKSAVKTAEKEEQAGKILAFVSDQFEKLRDESVEVRDKLEIAKDITESKCIPNLISGMELSQDTVDFCKEESECGTSTIMIDDKEVIACKTGKILDLQSKLFTKRSKRSVEIALDKLEKVKKITKNAIEGRVTPRSANSTLSRIVLEKDTNILRGLSEKLAGDAAYKKKLSEVLTGSFIEQFLWKNLDHITINQGMDLDNYHSVFTPNYGRLIDYQARKRKPIIKGLKPGVIYPIPLMFGMIWMERPRGREAYDQKVRGIFSVARHKLNDSMRAAINRNALDVGNFFKEIEVTAEALSDFDKGKSRVLPTTYKEGIDIPGANNLIIASAYTKPKDIIQLSGRIKRIADGKEPGETLFLTSRDTIDERYFRSSMRNLIMDVHHTEYWEEMLNELETMGT